MYGDQVNDHGLFSVTLNESRPVISNGRSGCGEPFGKTCEKLGGLHYFVGGLPEGEHRVRVENIPGEDGTYLGTSGQSRFFCCDVAFHRVRAFLAFGG
jgi:hypothetical protein